MKNLLTFVRLVGIIIITMEKSYECRTCKKLCVGFPATYRNKFMEWRLLEMRTLYERGRLSKLGKRELELEHRKLQKKIMNIDNYEVLDDDISNSEHSSDKDFVPETPVRKRAASLTSLKVTKRRKEKTDSEEESKEEGKDSEDSVQEKSKTESSGLEESEFFFSKKELEERARKRMKRQSKKSRKRKQKESEDSSDEEEPRKERNQKMKRESKKK